MTTTKILQAEVSILRRRLEFVESLVLLDPPLRDLLLYWPGGLRKLATRVGYGPSWMTWFSMARGAVFPEESAAKVARAFRTRGICPNNSALTLARIRAAWLREKGKGDA